MTPTSIEELDALLTVLKKHGVRACALESFQVSFVDPEEDDEPEEQADAVGFQVEVGRDGLTEEEQSALYGAPIDSNFRGQ